jgi:hypothetical protein
MQLFYARMRDSTHNEINGEDTIICKCLWPHRSADLNPCNFYLWRKLKSVASANNLHDLKALKQNISEAVYNIQKRELQPSFSKSVRKNSGMSHSREQIF